MSTEQGDQLQDLLTVRETSRVLKSCEKTVRNLIATGDLRVVRIGRSVRLTPQDVAAFIERARNAAGGK